MNQPQNQQFTVKKSSKKSLIVITIVIVIILGWAGLTKAGYIPNFMNIGILCPESSSYENGRNYFNGDSHNLPVPVKPLIYLYPQKKQDVYVKLNFDGTLTSSYPMYDESIEGWKVTAYPDGKIINHADNQEYSYLFWEGKSSTPVDWDFSRGFVVKGEDTMEFLQKTLSEIGLTPKEYNEFIVYWYPLLKDNRYNLIHFAEEQYTKMAPLEITPKPDSMLRVFMVFKPLDKKIEIEPQVFQPFERKGFTVVEWGGDKN